MYSVDQSSRRNCIIRKVAKILIGNLIVLFMISFSFINEIYFLFIDSINLHRRYPKSSETQGISESTTQKGRSRQSINKSSRCLLMESTNTQDQENAGSQLGSQSIDQVNYGSQPDERIESYEDYDWEQDRMIRCSRKDDEINCL